MIKPPTIFYGLYYQKDEKLIDKTVDDDKDILNFRNSHDFNNTEQNIHKSEKSTSWLKNIVNAIKFFIDYVITNRLNVCQRTRLQIEIEKAENPECIVPNNVCQQTQHQREVELSVIPNSNVINSYTSEQNYQQDIEQALNPESIILNNMCQRTQIQREVELSVNKISGVTNSYMSPKIQSQPEIHFYAKHKSNVADDISFEVKIDSPSILA